MGAMNARTGSVAKKKNGSDTGNILLPTWTERALFFFSAEWITLSFVILVTPFQAAPCNSDSGLDYSAIEA